MDWEDEYDDKYADTDLASHREASMPDKSAEGGFDLMDIVDPASAYFFLSDDAQDEITGEKEEHEVWVVRPQIRWRSLRKLP